MEKHRISSHEIEKPWAPFEPELPTNSDSSNLQKHFRKNLPGFSETTEFHRGSSSGGVGRPLVAWSFIAAFIDSLILFAMGCFFLVTFSWLVKSQMGPVVGFFEGSLLEFGLLAAVAWVAIYMILLRVFLGFTIGEWACGLRLGSLKQRLHRFYSLKVLARVFLVFASGLVLFPVLSMLTGKDIPGMIVRLPLVSLNQK